MNVKGQTKRILVVAVEWRHRANGLLQENIKYSRQCKKRDGGQGPGVVVDRILACFFFIYFFLGGGRGGRGEVRSIMYLGQSLLSVAVSFYWKLAMDSLVNLKIRTIPHMLEVSPAVSNLLIGIFTGALLGIPTIVTFPSAVYWYNLPISRFHNYCVGCSFNIHIGLDDSNINRYHRIIKLTKYQ